MQRNVKSGNISGQPCGEWQPLLMLSAAGGELEPAEQVRLTAHLANCAACSAALAGESELLAQLAANHNEPGAALLASCRAGLTDALDREEERGWLRRSFGLVLPSSWLSPRPAWSAAVLLLIGFSLGVLGPRLLRRPAGPVVSGNSATPNSTAILAAPDSAASADSTLAALDLHSADVAGISLFPSGNEGPPRVQLQLKSQRPVTVEGTVNDDDVKDVLLNVVSSGDRFCPDVRLDAVECLRSLSNEPDVRSALCHAVHTDHNAAVRLKALEALDGADPQDLIRQTLLDALVDDQNPGVRIEAINALREMAAKGQVASDGRVLAVLRDRMQKDPNTYIRLQSAAAIRDLGPREKF
ncbi:MAG TPA: HEAT repeat domain-containing protein [Candidatus Acidoferrales bacterium]|nr:HEAT repeat domain-containing protein [Candidatus Acidoferrales bacterium]